MTRRLVVRADAAADIRLAKQWYEVQRAGLGRLFVESLDRTLQRIARNAEQFPRVHGELRRAAISRFPYAIFYIHDEKMIRIVGCFHGRRDPNIWKRRLEES